MRDSELWKRLYTTYVRPHLEHSVHVWNPYDKKDVKILRESPEKSH